MFERRLSPQLGCSTLVTVVREEELREDVGQSPSVCSVAISDPLTFILLLHWPTLPMLSYAMLCRPVLGIFSYIELLVRDLLRLNILMPNEKIQ